MRIFTPNENAGIFCPDCVKGVIMLERIAEGRTDLVIDYVAEGNPPTSTTSDGGSLMQWCAYYGDVSALKFLLSNGETLQSLGEDMGLNAAAFYSHSRLCQFLVDNGANVSRDKDTGETPLHAALSSHRAAQYWVVKVLLDAGADPISQPSSRLNREPSCVMREPFLESMSSIKRAVKKKILSRPESRFCFSRPSPLSIGFAAEVLPFDSHKFLCLLRDFQRFLQRP
jgi:ankyrin repeat protein